MTIQRVVLTDDLNEICAQMQPDNWAYDNHMTSYQPDRLRHFLETGGMLILARDGQKIVGAIIAHILRHPAGEDSFYIHELDTHPDYRRQGVGKALMRTAFDIARELQLTEVWLGTELDNEPAKGLYSSLHPDETEPSIIYAYKVH